MRYTRDDFIGLDGNVNSLVERKGKKGIYGLFGKYRTLSNFHIKTVVVDGIEYPSSEAAYMAQKTDILEEKLELARQLSPRLAKELGQKVTLKPNWNDIRVREMKRVLIAKFQQAPELEALLIGTQDEYIEETNWWNDNFWGVCDTEVGQNNLGKTLMEVRSYLRSNGTIGG